MVEWTHEDANTDRECWTTSPSESNRFDLYFDDRGDSPGWVIESWTLGYDGEDLTDEGILDANDPDNLEEAQREAEAYLGLDRLTVAR